MTGDNVVALAGIMAGVVGTIFSILFSYFSKKMELKHQAENLILSEKKEVYSELVSNLTELPSNIHYPTSVLMKIIFLAN